MSDRLNNDKIMALLEEEAGRAVLNELRVSCFHAAVQAIPGKLGVLLRQIAHAHTEFEKAREAYGTTEGESVRLSAIVDDAMELVEFIDQNRPEARS